MFNTWLTLKKGKRSLTLALAGSRTSMLNRTSAKCKSRFKLGLGQNGRMHWKNGGAKKAAAADFSVCMCAEFLSHYSSHFSRGSDASISGTRNSVQSSTRDSSMFKLTCSKSNSKQFNSLQLSLHPSSGSSYIPVFFYSDKLIKRQSEAAKPKMQIIFFKKNTSPKFFPSSFHKQQSREQISCNGKAANEGQPVTVTGKPGWRAK